MSPSFCMLVISGIVFIFIRSRPEEKGLDQVGAVETKVDSESPKTGKSVSSLQWKQVYTMPAIWYLGIVYFFYGLSYIIYIVFFAAYLVKEIGLSQEWAGGLCLCRRSPISD